MLRDTAGAPGAREVTLRDGALGAVQTFGGGLDIDPGVLWEHKAHVAATVDGDDRAQLREQRAEPVGCSRLVPERVCELRSRDGPVSLHGEEREREPALPARELALHPPAVDSGAEAAAKVDPRLRQGFVKVTASRAVNNLLTVRNQGGRHEQG